MIHSLFRIGIAFEATASFVIAKIEVPPRSRVKGWGEGLLEGVTNVLGKSLRQLQAGCHKFCTLPFYFSLLTRAELLSHYYALVY
jgi:hypothetical protein